MTLLRPLLFIVEDDATFAGLLREILSGPGYETRCFSDADSAFECLKVIRPELVISDICLPGISGVAFCRLLKSTSRYCAIPVLILSALGDEGHKVEALKAGADDYVVKPFSQKELLARVEAVLRRTYFQGKTTAVLRSGGLTLDLERREAFVDGRTLPALLPKEYELLAFFLSRRRHVLSFRAIGEAVWGADSIATRTTIKVHVHRLRVKLGVYGACIEPVVGVGYRWED